MMPRGQVFDSLCEDNAITNSQDLAVLIKDLGDGSINPITTATEYNSKDNVVKETNTEGNYKTYEYDIDDSITDVTYPSSTSSNVKGLKLTYNDDKWLHK